MRLLVVDNYDSFTWNLVHYLEDLTGEKVSVKRNDEVNVADVKNYDRIVLSPGPGLPSESGNLMEIIAEATAKKIPLLGVCLGLQAITEHYGGRLLNLNKVMHGLQRDCLIMLEDEIFRDVPKHFPAGRYHSWVADPQGFPAALQILAKDEEGQIMAIRHVSDPVYALQFHPESVMTPDGKQMLSNWLDMPVNNV